MSSEEAVEYPSQHVVTCEGCGSTVSINWFCKNCPGSMCDNCKATHLISGFTKKHLVVPRTGKVVRMYGPAKIAEECRVHTGKEVITYCLVCKVACCVSCLAEKHQQHKFSVIEDQYLSAEKRLNDYTKELESEVRPKLKDLIKQGQLQMTQSEQFATDAVAEVNAFRNEFKQAVDHSCDAIIKDIRKPNNELNTFIENVKMKVKTLDELVEQITARIREGKLSLIEYVPPTTDTLIPTLAAPKLFRLKFTPNREALLSMRRQIGTVQQEETDESNARSRGTSVPLKFDRSMISVKKVSSFKSQIYVRVICMVDDDKAWIAYYDNDTAYMYNQSGCLLKTLTIQKGCGINDLIAKESGELIVTNEDEKLRLLGKDGSVSILIDTKPFIPEGVCLSDKEKIVVCLRGVDHVTVYSPDGRMKLREIRVKNAQGQQLFTNPYRVVQNCGDMCVVNVDRNVVCVNERGDVRWLYDGTQAKLSKKFQPYGICKDKFHNLLVADYKNQCVHYIDKDGQLIQVILQQEYVGIMDPVAICVNDKTGHVWLGNINQKDVLVAKYLKP